MCLALGNNFPYTRKTAKSPENNPPLNLKDTSIKAVNLNKRIYIEVAGLTAVNKFNTNNKCTYSREGMRTVQEHMPILLKHISL